MHLGQPNNQVIRNDNKKAFERTVNGGGKNNFGPTIQDLLIFIMESKDFPHSFI